MAMSGLLQIDILGTSFSIHADEDPSYLQALLSYYKRMVDSVEKKADLKDPLKTSILAGILLVDELYQERLKSSPKTQQELKEAEVLTQRIIEKLDKISNL